MKKMCNKAVDNYPRVLEFVFDCYKIKKMWNIALDTYSSAIQFVLLQLMYGSRNVC